MVNQETKPLALLGGTTKDRYFLQVPGAGTGPNPGLQPTPTASARASLRLLARLRPSVGQRKVSAMPGFRWSKIKTEMLGRDDRDWHAYIEVRSPAIPELHEVVSIGGHYLLSLGAHATHCTLLMDKNAPEPLTVARCLLCCAVLTFATDSPVVPVFHTTKLSANDARSFARMLGGTAFRTVDEYGEKLSDLAEAANVYTQTGFSAPHSIVRTMMRSSPKPDCWIYYPWPPTEVVSRSLAAYWMASLSILSPSRILNFWRAIEAVTSPSERETLLADLHLGRLSPVWTEATRIPVTKYRQRRLDACRLLRRVAMRRRDELIAKHGSAKAALKFVYEEGRWKADHADRKSLEYDMVAFIGDQLRDAELLRYMAREAIEHAWNARCPTKACS